jgi:predicted transcriptional regulator
MNIQSEKLSLINWLTQVTDEDIIAQVKRIMIQKSDWWDELDDHQKSDIDAGLADLDAGRKKELSEVLKKYD